MRARDWLTRAAIRLDATSTTPRLDAELLLAHSLGCSRSALLLRRLDDDIDAAAADIVLMRRLHHEPMAYITGVREFWSLDLHVTPDVLIPRPDSETLVAAALDWLSPDRPAAVLDLGTGSGALLLAVLSERPHAWGLGVDRSEAALAVASANAHGLRLAPRTAWLCCDWSAAIDARFDLILCNPPYIESGAVLAADVADYEPADALFAGTDGLDAYRAIVPALPPLLARGGAAVLEIGHRQAVAVAALAEASALSCTVLRDIEGRDRALQLTRN